MRRTRRKHNGSTTKLSCAKILITILTFLSKDAIAFMPFKKKASLRNSFVLPNSFNTASRGKVEHIFSAFLPGNVKRKGSQQCITTRLHSSPDSNNAITIFSRRNILKIASGSLLALPLVGEIYARTGSPNLKEILLNTFGSTASESWRSTRNVTLIFHGAGGQDSNTDALIYTLKNSSDTNDLVQMVDWSDDSKDTLQASINGEKVGRAVARKLIEMFDLGIRGPSSVHLIGISVGAFAANSCVQELNSKLTEKGNRENVDMQLTLLDPFSQRAILGIGYGNSEFGKGANYAQQFLNTDDPVPSTNSALKYCAVTDVTNLRPQNLFGHGESQ